MTNTATTHNTDQADAVAGLSSLGVTPSSVINADNLYKQLTLHETLIVTCLLSAVPTIKKRLIKKKYLDNQLLGDFADKSHRLSFTIIHKWDVEPTTLDGEIVKKCKLRITLAATSVSPIDGIDGIETAPPLIEGEVDYNDTPDGGIS